MNSGGYYGQNYGQNRVYQANVSNLNKSIQKTIWQSSSITTRSLFQNNHRSKFILFYKHLI